MTLPKTEGINRVVKGVVLQFEVQLIIRSHEGPDARDKRHDLSGMDHGYTIDHEVDSGKSITIFSAPDYPQFQVPLSYLS